FLDRATKRKGEFAIHFGFALQCLGWILSGIQKEPRLAQVVAKLRDVVGGIPQLAEKVYGAVPLVAAGLGHYIYRNTARAAMFRLATQANQVHFMYSIKVDVDQRSPRTPSWICIVHAVHQKFVFVGAAPVSGGAGKPGGISAAIKHAGRKQRQIVKGIAAR